MALVQNDFGACLLYLCTTQEQNGRLWTPCPQIREKLALRIQRWFLPRALLVNSNASHLTEPLQEVTYSMVSAPLLGTGENYYLQLSAFCFKPTSPWDNLRTGP
jgi:hypothetical protein